MRQDPPQTTDRTLLVEAGLVLLLFALFIGLYFVPAGRGQLVPEWWVWPVLGSLFFGILLLERWRRKHREKGRLSRGLRDFPEETPDGEL